jgi:hypothetical protein
VAFCKRSLDMPTASGVARSKGTDPCVAEMAEQATIRTDIALISEGYVRMGSCLPTAGQHITQFCRLAAQLCQQPLERCRLYGLDHVHVQAHLR